MRILVTLDYYHPHWTGLTAYAKRLAEGLVARGHQVTVLTSQHEPYLPRHEVVNGVHIERAWVAARLSRGVVMPAFPAAVVRLLARHDLVHIHTPMPEALLVTALARAIKKPSLVTHQGDVVMPAGRFNAIIQYGVVLMRLGMQFADYIVVHSADYGRHSLFLAPFGSKLGAIYPPVELPAPRPGMVADLRRSLGLDGKQVVGFAGRFVEEKGFDILLKAMPSVVEQVPNAHFVFAGETNVRYEDFYASCAPLIHANRAHLSMLGLLHDAQELADFYALCDTFVLPSRTDCFPSVQLEALLSGTPLVTTDIPGAREVVKVTGNGILVPANSPQGLADGIVAMLRDRAAYQPSRSAVHTLFGIDRCLERYEELMCLLSQVYPPKLPALPPV